MVFLHKLHKKDLRNPLKGVFVLAFILIIVLFLLPQTTLAAPSENAGSFSDLASALADVDNGGVVVITNSFEMTGDISIPDGKEITIRSTAGEFFTLERAANYKGSFFSIPATSTVSFENITLDGKEYNANYSLIDNGGTLNLNAGTHLTNNRKYAPVYVGGGVNNTGTLKIADGATISNCFAGTENGGAVQNEGNLIMTGGMITGNTGKGAVQNAGNPGGTLTMTGGSIINNMDPYGNASGAGGGVHHDGSGFVLSGDARITPNTVNLHDRIIHITAPLSGFIAIYVPSDAAEGKVIATGDGYILTDSDKAVFSVSNGFDLLLKNNSLVLQKTASPNNTIAVTGITLDKESAEIHAGKALRLTAEVVPSDATNKGLTWSSSDPGIAGVDTNGNVTGIKAGTALITVTTDDGGYTAASRITVLEVSVPRSGR